MRRRDEPVCNEDFEVEKKFPSHDHGAEANKFRVLRLIVSPTPQQCFALSDQEDSWEMGYAGWWPLLVLSESEFMLCFSGDQIGCCHAYEIPSRWRRFFVLWKEGALACAGRGVGSFHSRQNQGLPGGLVSGS